MPRRRRLSGAAAASVAAHQAREAAREAARLAANVAALEPPPPSAVPVAVGQTRAAPSEAQNPRAPCRRRTSGGIATEAARIFSQNEPGSIHETGKNTREAPAAHAQEEREQRQQVQRRGDRHVY